MGFSIEHLGRSTRQWLAKRRHPEGIKEVPTVVLEPDREPTTLTAFVQGNERFQLQAGNVVLVITPREDKLVLTGINPQRYCEHAVTVSGTETYPPIVKVLERQGERTTDLYAVGTGEYERSLAVPLPESGSVEFQKTPVFYARPYESPGTIILQENKAQLVTQPRQQK